MLSRWYIRSSRVSRHRDRSGLFPASLVVGTLAVALVALGLCDASAQTKVGKLVFINGTAPPDPTTHHVYYALENGFYAEEGLEVETKAVTGDVNALRALLAGEGDILLGAFGNIVQAVERGSKLKNIMAIAPKLDYLLIAEKGIPNLKALAGKNVAVSQPGAVSYHVPKLMIEKAGGDPSKVNWVSVGGSAARIQALVARKVQAAAVGATFAARAVKYDHLHAIGDAANDLPSYVYAWEVTTEDVLQKKRASIQAFVTGTIRGARWGMQNPDKAIAISQKILPDAPKDELAAGVREFARKRYWNADGTLPREAWEFTIAEMLKTGDLKRPLKYEDMVVTEFAERAVRKLGPFKP